MAQVDYFLKLDGIKGEAKADGKTDQIQLESWSFGASQQGTHGSGGGGGAGKVLMQDVHFVKYMDKSSPKLFAACSAGTHIASAVLTARKAGDKPLEFLEIKLTDCLVSSYQSGGSGEASVVPTDQFSLNFSKVEVNYVEQNAKGGAGEPVKAGFDVKANKKL
jgi:type VI secretion system secreted protein Hcp